MTSYLDASMVFSTDVAPHPVPRITRRSRGCEELGSRKRGGGGRGWG